MKKAKDVTRRSFLKSATAGITGLSIAGSGIKSAIAGTKNSLAWSSGDQVNPQISNNLVVCCHDPQMFKNEQDATVADTFHEQNEVVDTERVETNMDGIAVNLSGKDDPDEAWAAIFRKPEEKQWNEVKAAIKVNCIYTGIMPRIAIVGKVCKELIKLGVQPSNITIYDACHNAYGSDKCSPYVGNGLPENIIVSNSVQTGSRIPVGSSTFKCTDVLAVSSGNSVVYTNDILVNCSVNKGHSLTDKGGFTLSLKNHTGTMKFSCPSLQEMIDENKSEVILGGNPARQQLCIVDSLWAAIKGPFDPPSHLPARIIMGTFGPAVDIAVVRNIREKLMRASHTESAIQTILSSFGISENDLQWKEIEAYDPTPVSRSRNKKSANSFCMIINGSSKASEIFFQVPSQVSDIEISDLSGKLIRSMNNISLKGKMAWDGLSRTGKRVKTGVYIIRVKGNGFTQSQRVNVL